MSTYRFGPHVIDLRERRVLRDGVPVPLAPKVFDTLAYLVERHGHLVGRDELIQAIWADAHVEEGGLSRTIHLLRKALAGSDGSREAHRRFIETVPKRGYRFTGDVARVDGVPALGPEATASDSGSATPPAGPVSTWRSPLMAAGAAALMAVTVSAWHAFARQGEEAPRPVLTPPTASGPAFTRFQSGRVRMDRRYRGDAQAARQDFEAAIQLDPSFAAAYAGKADAQLFLYWDTGAHDDIAQARSAIDKAIEIDPRSAYARALRCRLLATYDWKFEDAEGECRRAIALDPGDHAAHRELAFLLASRGRIDEGLKAIDTAVAIAPTSFNKRSRGLLLYWNRQFDQAIAQLMQVEATDPEFVESSRWIARCFEQKREYDRALAFVLRFRESAGAPPDEIAALRAAFKAGGWSGVLRATVGQLPPEPNLDNAGSLAQVGETDAAFGVLEAMIMSRRVMILHMNVEPRLDPLRSDPRFAQLVRRVGI